MESYFAITNNTKNLVPSQSLINPSFLSNIIRKRLESIKLFYKML